MSGVYNYQHCYQGNTIFGMTSKSLCRCRLLTMVDEDFQGEIENLREYPEHVEPPLPRKLPT